MRIVEGNIKDLLQGKRQYKIPKYQRNYSWEKSDAEKLIKDIIKVASDEKRDCHYIGSVLYSPIENTQNANAIQKSMLIDGQQRLTTFCLILIALSQYAFDTLSKEEYEQSELLYDDIKETYLLNARYQSDEDKYKLILSDYDFPTYKKIVNKISLTPDEEQTTLWQNYNHIYNYLLKNKINPKTILFALNSKIKIADIVITQSDNPQLIFETVNTTGKLLMDYELVKNFLFMHINNPTKLDTVFIESWKPLEEKLNHNNDIENDFFRYYIESVSKEKLGNSYYVDYKNYYVENALDPVREIKKINKYCDFFLRWKNANQHSSDPLDVAINQIKESGQEATVPVILTILNSLSENQINEQRALEMLKTIESYCYRRILLGRPSRSIRNAMSVINKKFAPGKEFEQSLIDLYGKQSMPTNSEIYSELKVKNQYQDNYMIRDILERLEKHLNIEHVRQDNWSIEHIMPETIRESDKIKAEDKEDYDWANDLGSNWQKIHETYCHTIGNLTLSALPYNIEYSNKRFTKKKNMPNGYNQTNVRLSHTLKNYNEWGEKQILERCELLAKYIIEIWPYPKVI